MKKTEGRVSIKSIIFDVERTNIIKLNMTCRKSEHLAGDLG